MEHPLARHAPASMVELWGEKWGVYWERKLWLAVARAQMMVGVFDHIEHIGPKLQAYATRANDIRLWEIREIELTTRHDVKARLEGFNKVASEEFGEPLELMHWGMTSADVVDNLALARIREAMVILGQPDWAERIRFRGIKGAVGTQQDMIDLVGSENRAFQLDRQVASDMGFTRLMGSVGQVYPRSLDFEYATMLMSLITLQPWRAIANGYYQMIADYSGSQWNEGDVSTSVIRRVALPGICLTASIACPLPSQLERTAI